MGPRGKIFASSFPQCLIDPHEPGIANTANRGHGTVSVGADGSSGD